MFAAPVIAAALTLSPGQIFDGLTGSCFRADVLRESTDTHCFTASAGGKLVMDIHKVRNGNNEIIYEGVTLYRTDKDTVGYSYFNSDGDLFPGSATRSGDAIVFAPDLKWTLTGDGYDVVSARGTLHFSKTGPAGEGGL